MGHMLYHGGQHEFDDRLLAHIRAAVGVKLRRHESFYLCWTKKLKEGDGRIAIWVTPYAPLTFRFREAGSLNLIRLGYVCLRKPRIVPSACE
ncbi:DUF7882 family protein [Leucobacter tardus]|uniref:DUF7882 family protein n=1 Tax=Leucobacter tardus TaxID=501483 RepID=UPI003F8CFB95